MHPRQAIRQAVVGILKGKTSAANRVFPTRVIPYRNHQLPVISVYTLDETVSGDSLQTAPRELTRDLALTIEGWVQPGPNVDNAVDDLAWEIEQAMHADPFLGDAAADSYLVSTQMESLEETDREVGFLAMNYEVSYRTCAPDLDGSTFLGGAAPGEYLTTEATHQIEDGIAPDDTDPAIDSFEMRP